MYEFYSVNERDRSHEIIEKWMRTNMHVGILFYKINVNL